MGEKIKVREHERTKPLKPAGDKSRVSDPQQAELGQGVRIHSKGGAVRGVEQMSKREGGDDLETQVEVRVGDDRSAEGTKQYQRII